MKTFPLIGVLALTSCALATKHEHFTPPSAVEVQQSVAKVREYVRPEGKIVFSGLEKALADYQRKVEAQTVLLSKAQDDAAYWHQKHSECLRRLWWWRGIALATVAAVALYIGLKTSWRFFL